MIQALSNRMSFEEFTIWLPPDERYELIDGVVFEMQPTGVHEEVTEFLSTQLTLEAFREQLSYKFPRRALLKAPDWGTGYLPDLYLPDLLVIDPEALVQEPLWKKQATLTQGASVKLVVEVVSTHWEMDYARKLEDYESMGILEYWIVDPQGLGGKKHIGFPKQPTLNVYQLVQGEYRVQQFRGNDRILSSPFPNLMLTAAQVLTAGQDR